MTENKFYSIDYRIKTNQVVIQGVPVMYSVKVQEPNQYEKETKILIEFNHFTHNMRMNFPKMSELFMPKLQKHIERTIEKFVMKQIQEGFSYPSMY